MHTYKHSIQQSALQLRDQLSSNKRKLGFFFGAGTSMAVGVPGVIKLTKEISKVIEEKYKDQFDSLCESIDSNNIEHILSKLRTIRELIGDSSQTIFNIKGKENGQSLDCAICKAISQIVSQVITSDLEPHFKLSNWLFQNQASRNTPIELFTTNYDLLFEEALEYKRLPYFDGFVGSIHPFLTPESIEAENIKNDQSCYVPYSWLRLWKIHGSINWFLIKDTSGKQRIIRSTHKGINDGGELMIYPSKQKYDDSRRLPFLVFQDRLRKFLSSGETLLVIVGYSFGDDHINELIFQALSTNKRLAITALMYGDYRDDSSSRRYIDQKILNFGLEHPNFTVIGPDKACIGGLISEWKEETLDNLHFWDIVNQNMNLGDFKEFSDYLQLSFGVLSEMPEVKKELTVDEK